MRTKLKVKTRSRPLVQRGGTGGNGGSANGCASSCGHSGGRMA